MKTVVNYIDQASEMNFYVDQSIEKFTINTYDLIYTIEGEIQLSSKGSQYTIQSNEVLILNKHENYEIESLTKDCIYFVFSISDNLLLHESIREGLVFACNSVTKPSNSYDILKKNIQVICELVLSKNDKSSFLLLSKIFELLNNLVINYSTYSQAFIEDNVQIRNILLYIMNNYSEDLNLNVLSEKFHLESGYFSKYFKKNVGINFKDYLSNIRITFSQRDLIYTNNSIARIATNNGFSNITSFNNNFKKYTSLTPSEFRKQNKESKSSNVSVLTDKVVDRVKSSIKLSSANRDTNLNIIEVNKEGTLFEPFWKKIINIGSATDSLSVGIKEHLKIIKKELDFKYGRIWHLFDDEMYVDWVQGQINNFSKINNVLDFFVEIGIIPWIDFNKKNKNFGDPLLQAKNIERWNIILKQFMNHIINRYGITQVKKWKFEISCENSENDNTVELYNTYFRATKATIKRFSDNIMLGGAGFKNENKGLKLDATLKQFCIEEMDFYSFMYYPYEANQSKEFRNNQRATNADHFVNIENVIANVLSSRAKKPFYITEFNNTVSNRNMLNDTLYKGAYIVKNIIDTFNKIDGIGYWSASDLYHFNVHATDLLNGGSGLITKDGIEKPAFTAFNFLNEIESLKYIDQKENFIVFKSDEGYLIFGCNYVHPNQLYFLKDENEIVPSDIPKFFPNETVEFKIRLSQIDSGDYEMRTYLCNQKNGSIFDLWKELGFATNLKPSDLDYLKKKNSIELKLQNVTVPSNYLDISEQFTDNELFIVHLYKKFR